MARYTIHQVGREQREIVLDGWCVGVGVAQLGIRAEISTHAVGSIIYRARLDMDARAIKGVPRKLVVEARKAAITRAKNRGQTPVEADLVAAAHRALTGDAPPPTAAPAPKCAYRLARSFGIEPVERLVPNRVSLGSTGPGVVSITLARIPSIDGHRPLIGR